MMAGHSEGDLAVGGPARHIPVLLAEVLKAVAAGPGQVVVDGTFGAGGYTSALLDGGATVVAFDRDPDAIAGGQALEAASGGRLKLVHAPFSQLDHHVDAADTVVLDIGVSSMQIDQAERGFSFRNDGPLDMRMAQDGATAADVVNRYKSGDLTRLFGLLGEERHAGRIARAIERRRAEAPFVRTGQLAKLVADVVGFSPRDKIHPATRVFQALRIHVNDELGELAQALLAAERILRPGGRLVVVTFHSLEDRIVKRFLADRSSPPASSRHMPEAKADRPTFERPAKAVSPAEGEIEANPRSRSARLRVGVRTDAPARATGLEGFGLPKLPDIRSASVR
jgi:16S rRNA (cytosine1402-N4)-methyltransferase